MNAAPSRYREAEEALWQRYGLDPVERFLEVGPSRTRLRVTEVGSGPPVLLLGGTGGTGPYLAPVVQHLQDFRCLVLDRPGFGLSDPVEYRGADYRTLVATLLADALDALAIPQADVIGASIGGVWSLLLAERHPARVRRHVILGGGPLVPEIVPPTFIKLLRTPLGAVMVRIPEKPKMLQGQLRGLGHGASLDAGRIPEEFLTYHMALTRHTKSLHHERSMVQAVLGRKGFKDGLTFDPQRLAKLHHPTLMVWGTQDPVGSLEVWKAFVTALPNAELHVVEGGGVMPWWDDPAGVGRRVHDFFSVAASPDGDLTRASHTMRASGA